MVEEGMERGGAGFAAMGAMIKEFVKVLFFTSFFECFFLD